ncbi:MAG: HD domain-containing protein [Anaerolineae bacterium]|nr:HD domain-containing protein [Anaerolineae bacterium]
MADDRFERQLRFILEVDQLKQVLRRNYLINGERRENSAEHSWHIVLAATILAEYSDEPVDLRHVLKMLAVHDIVEIDAGDTFAYDVAGNADKDTREQTAADRIFGLLPDDQRDELRALWDEFEALVSPEARFARAVDMLMPMLHNRYSGGRGWQENGVTSGQVLKRQIQIGAASGTLWEKAQAVVAEAVALGYLSK